MSSEIARGLALVPILFLFVERPAVAEHASPVAVRAASAPSGKVDAVLSADLQRRIAAVEKGIAALEKQDSPLARKQVEMARRSLEALRSKQANRKNEAGIIESLKGSVTTMSAVDARPKDFYEAVLAAHRDLLALGLVENYADTVIVLAANDLVPKENLPAVKAAFVTFAFRGIETFEAYRAKTAAEQVRMKAELMDLLVRRSSGMSRGKGPGFEGFAPGNEFLAHEHLAKVFDESFAATLHGGSIPAFQVSDRFPHLRARMAEVFNGGRRED